MAWENSTRRSRLPPDWPAIRLRVLQRDRYRCQLEFDCCTTVAVEVDHINAGDDHRESQLQSACHACHARKSGREGAAARPPLHRPPERHPGLA